IRVHVRPEPRPGGFEVRDQFTGLEVRASIERHVLDQMGESLLVVLLEERSRLHRQAQGDALFRPGVLSHEVGEPVGKGRRPNGSVEGNRLLKIDRRPGGRLGRNHRRQREDERNPDNGSHRPDYKRGPYRGRARLTLTGTVSPRLTSISVTK